MHFLFFILFLQFEKAIIFNRVLINIKEGNLIEHCKDSILMFFVIDFNKYYRGFFRLMKNYVIKSGKGGIQNEYKH